MTHSNVLAWRHEYVQTDRIKLHCVTQGEGELVILLHSFLEFWYSWRHQLPWLSQWFKVVVPDLRGYNDSEKPTAGYDLESLGQDIQSLIATLGYSKAIVIGHGLGGTIAWHLAQRFPNSLKSVILLASPHPQRLVQSLGSSWEQLRRNWYILAAQLPALPEWLLSQNLTNVVQSLFQNQAVRKSAFSNEDTAIYQAALAKPGVITAALNYYRQFLAPDNLVRAITQSPKPIQLPALIMWGEDDSMFSPTLLAGVERLVHGPLENIAIPNCGHWLNQEAPRTVNRAVIDFLRHQDLLPQNRNLALNSSSN